MWHEGSPSLQLTKKYDVELTAHYLNAFEEGGKAFVNRVITVEGPDAQQFIKAFFKAEKSRANILEADGRQIFYSIRSSDQYHSLMLGSKIFFVKPIRVKEGFEFWTVGAHAKRSITELVKKINSTGKSTAGILSLRQEKPVFHASGLLGCLSPKQLKMLELAAAEGYYGYPRKADLALIASKAGLSKTAVRASLRRAEGKVFGAIASLFQA